jgi:sortase A
MTRDRRSVDDLTIEELEATLRRRKREAREERLRRLRESGRARDDLPPPGERPRGVRGLLPAELPSDSPGRRLFNRVLLAVEIGAVLAFVYVIVLLVGAVQETNEATGTPVAGLPSPTPPAQIDVVFLPSGHHPPNAQGETTPGEAGGIPEHLRDKVAALTPLPIPTAGPEQARLIEIPAINVRAQVVEGDGWEQLKKGVGHHAGTANPGEKGNMVLTGHNDVFGEVFRYLENVKKGDRIYIETTTKRYSYVVAADPRIVEPTEVSVMLPSREATTTLITCHPYLIDTQRLIIVATLADE